MRNTKCLSMLLGLFISMISVSLKAENAIKVLGKDFVFPNAINSMPAKLSEISGLQINSFVSNDGIKLSYWEAGKGEPLIFVPGWSANGAEYINLISLLKDKYHVYVLDQRNQGLSQHTKSGSRISRLAQDLNEFTNHIKVKKAYLCGWSMGAAVTWSYIDLFGDDKISKLVLIDEAPSIYAHSDWPEDVREKSGAFTTSAEMLVSAFTAGTEVNKLIVNTDVPQRFGQRDSLYFQNSQALSAAFVKTDVAFLKDILFDHATNDWRDVISTKIKVPTAIFSGEDSNWLPSQKWEQSVIKGSQIFIYKSAESGDHFLHLKNPVKFAKDLDGFLKGPK